MEEEIIKEEKIYTEADLKRMRNLRMFQGQTDEEIVEYLNNRPEKPDDHELTDEELHQQQFDRRLRKLQKEYAVDMNDSNDAESLRSLVRLSIQNEVIDEKIHKELKGTTESRDLKNLTDAQRGIISSMGELQDKLGISRKVRKEKQYDDIPQYIASLQKRAAKFWDRKTSAVMCPRCEIELARAWINFPKLPNKLSFEGKCWKCEETVIVNI